MYAVNQAGIHLVKHQETAMAQLFQIGIFQSMKYHILQNFGGGNV